MERAEARKDTASQPPAVATLDGVARRMNFDLRAQSMIWYVVRCCEGAETHVGDVPLELGAEPVGEAGEEAAATCEDDVPEQHLTEVGVACS